METRNQYIERLSARLHEWDAQIDVLKARAETAKEDARLSFKQQIIKLREDRERAADLLKELHEAGEQNWMTIRQRVDDLISDVKDIFRKAA